MFLGVTYKSWVFLIGSSLMLAVLGAFSKSNISQSEETFVGSFFFIFVWALIIGIIFLQEKITDSDYKELMEANNTYYANEMDAVVTISAWSRYWHEILRVHRYIVLVLLQTLFVCGFCFLIK